ncbi:hypothetical protein EVAR_60499_1 [Eumeta japonica]|uniref:Uncharacterized protein n=1 Tax=Eumeta variegata TaxID=151549 RepID=A0A4C1ZG55_EUMVA|nr:hypothetical protein EVAR_60499_1 [Eumeta japonica]
MKADQKVRYTACVVGKSARVALKKFYADQIGGHVKGAPECLHETINGYQWSKTHVKIVPCENLWSLLTQDAGNGRAAPLTVMIEGCIHPPAPLSARYVRTYRSPSVQTRACASSLRFGCA